MADTAMRPYGPAQPGTSPATGYTVPGSTTTILRHIRVANTTGTAATFTISIGTDAAATRIFDTISVNGNSVFDWSGWQVMTAGEILQLTQGTASALTITISGVEVT